MIIDSCILQNSGAPCSEIGSQLSASNCANVSFVLTFTIVNEGNSTESITLYTGGKGNSRLKFINLNPLPGGQNTSVSERVVVLNGCSGATLDINATAITSGPGPICEATASFSQALPLVTNPPSSLPGTSPPSVSPVIGASTAAPTFKGCSENFVLDFKTAGNGTVLENGDYVGKDWYTEYGISIYAQGPGAFTPNGNARIFDTSRPGITGAGDLGLGSPNQLCSGGGPGVGSGGAPNATGANCNALGNVLIVQDSDTSVPEDNEPGGNLVFIFSPPRTILSIGLLNVGSTVPLIMNTASGSRNIQFVASVGPNGYQDVSVGVASVVKLQVQLPGVGAVTQVGFCTASLSDSPSIAPSTTPSQIALPIVTTSPSAAPFASAATTVPASNSPSFAPTASTIAPSAALVPLSSAPSLPSPTKVPFGVCGLIVSHSMLILS
jgi:hypothetical protein